MLSILLEAVKQRSNADDSMHAVNKYASWHRWECDLMIRGHELIVADDDMHDIARAMSRSLNLANGFRDVSSLFLFCSNYYYSTTTKGSCLSWRKPRTSVNGLFSVSVWTVLGVRTLTSALLRLI